jgi:uncharacterized protein
MKKNVIPAADIDRTETWIKYRNRLCDDCRAGCCTLPVEVTLADLVRMEVIDAFEAQEPAKVIARKLKKSGIVDHFNQRSALFTLAQLASGDCIYLDGATRRCTIYPRRPDTCRNHPTVGPRPGFCAYSPK